MLHYMHTVLNLLLKFGDTVKKGDVIMKSGSTGLSTGPHLHFEVRINGVAVDSLPYITGGTKTQKEDTDTTNNTINNEENNVGN